VKAIGGVRLKTGLKE